ncbi:UDP-N-acetyl-D-galactosamine dehydrogenase [Aneurinibacillus soli]|uniref:UDP-N-acetyl-D-glucosamine 6-dehydrogenase n=1 Tax=Aneurinibacillus soli TaxID=1500254 RepID=A0A0U5AWG9_9BACL|nr:nucleotide sugar dehydrogenase [Aneurinibacillus soli]PYE64148.1 UDP-N-acetyl-D-galactosamine dehydrogenase [Aneurinibacillus soli]BAU28097.1 UDP-N-acetyl-D-glucosamine 6-dehydrogenase [Aneurinibacillus soli]
MKKRRIGVVGLGYVGLPVAVAFGKQYPVIGFDINPERVACLIEHIDITGEVAQEELSKAQITYTANAEKLAACDFIIVAVPTPINKVNQPDLTPLIKASEMVGKHIRPGTIIVYESTVYPGATEEVCVPLIEKHSGFICGKDFFVGYSPERINPGDKKHTFETITKVVSGQDKETLAVIADVYGSVVKAGVHQASSIKVAEAAKVIENTQRDLNIALMNELAIIFNKLGINTQEVLKAAGTKWNFIPFYPGLVGGHCIGVDPYYLTYKAECIGYHPEVILAGRRINDTMGSFIAQSLVKKMILKGVTIQGARVTVLGMTFKENVPDIRNSRVIDIIQELQEFGIEVQVTDNMANKEDTFREYGVSLLSVNELQPADAIVLAVAHKEYVENGWEGIYPLLVNQKGVIADIKSVLNSFECPEDVIHWRL